MAEAGQAGDLQDLKYLDPDVRQENTDHIRNQIAEFVKTVPAETSFVAAQEIAGMPWGIVRAPDELLDDEHFRERGFFIDVEHPELGQTFTYPGAAAVFTATPQQIYRRAPLVGEDTAQVLGAAKLRKELAAALVQP